MKVPLCTIRDSHEFPVEDHNFAFLHGAKETSSILGTFFPEAEMQEEQTLRQIASETVPRPLLKVAFVCR